jgi:chaperone modulatory protein CbpM
MSDNNTTVTVLSGEIVEQRDPLSLAELCQQYEVHAEWIVDLVDEGILEPEGEQPMQWRFSGECCVRISMVLRLQRDLGVNLAGTALALELLDELRELRRIQEV